MAISLVPPLGAISILTTIPIFIFNISFAVVLRGQNMPMGIFAIVAALLEVVAFLPILAIVYQSHWNRNQGQEKALLPLPSLLIIACILCFLSAALTLATLAWMQIRHADLPAKTIGVSTTSLLLASFVLWGFSSITQALFLSSLLYEGRRTAHKTHSLRMDEEPHKSAAVRQISRQQTERPPSRARSSTDVGSLSSKSRKRSGSETMTSIRSSITQVVRPISSKTRLVIPKPAYRPTSLDSGTGEREIAEESFDSWDTSGVDPQSRQFVMLSTATSTSHSSPVQGRFLETIPASPPGSRSPSPGYPLDLAPPPRKRRSRSYSPANSSEKEAPRKRNRAVTISPSPSESEAHIHPLFRTDSPTPPPSATPGTVVTAAPGAGLTISDRQSLRSLSRMRSGSLPPSPLVHSHSMDDISRKMTSREDVNRGGLGDGSDEDDSVEGEKERSPSPEERQMTPPIPDWVLGAGPRELIGYSRRKQGLGLGAVGEER